jgi:hypothetical protein
MFIVDMLPVVILLEFTSVIDPLSTAKLPVTVKSNTLEFPVTLRLANVPTLVMFGCALVVKLPCNVSALTNDVADKLVTDALPFSISSFVS